MESSSFYTALICALIYTALALPPDGRFDQSAIRQPQAEVLEHETRRENGDEAWGYVTVRENAHMFWWLYHSTAPGGYMSRPLIIWLQGGPGASSTGFGNFEELGPLDVNLNKRNTTWVSEANVLFIDNPVGTGYSYVTSDDAYTKNVAEIADDLVTLTKRFLGTYPEFKTTPLYIFCESYGGKMTAAFAQALHKAIRSGEVVADFHGIALGDSWISPVDYVMTWGPYLYSTSLVDAEALGRINATAESCKAAYEAGNYTQSTVLWNKLEGVVGQETAGVNWYNILKWQQSDFSRENGQTYLDQLYAVHVKPQANDAISKLMNGPIREKLGIIPDNVMWGGQSGKVFQKQSGDFMKPVVDIVDDLLTNTNLKVVVYNGQLDLICCTIGTERWVQRLQWDNLKDYNGAKRSALTYKSGVPWGYLKEFNNFSFYWILDAGHMVPQDVGVPALEMVKRIIQG